MSLGIGFIGAGEFSVLHAEAIKKSYGAHLVGLWNRNEERRRKRVKEFGCKSFATPEQLIASPEVDAVFVLTNLDTHVEYAELSIKAGKHVFIEKPVATKTSEVQYLQQLASKYNVQCVPGHNMIHEESIKRIKKMIHDGKLGEIFSIHVMYNMFHPEEIAARYPGIIRQIFTHNLYSLIYLGGKPVKVSAFKAKLHYEQLEQEDIAQANIIMESGALAHISASFAADDLSTDPWTFIIKVIGSKGSARYSYQDWVEAAKDSFHTRTYTAYQDTVINEVQYFVDVCVKGIPALSTMNDAVLAQKCMEAIEESIIQEKVIYLL
jgi:predicted dehydrogenase